MKNILGIVRKKWSANEKRYYFSALDYYDEVIFIDPREVIYTFEQGNPKPKIDYNGFILNDLSMLYTFGCGIEMLLLVQSLMLHSCPISDTFEILSRNGIGKVAEKISSCRNDSLTRSYNICSYSSAKRFFDDFPDNKFPLVSKPGFGNKGKGIIKLADKKQALIYLRYYFSNTRKFIVLESVMNYIKEWRAYIVEGEMLFSYEKKTPNRSFPTNLHQSAAMVPTDSNDIEMIHDFVQKIITEEYQHGIYGVDIALTNAGTLYLIQINRTPATRGLREISPDFNFFSEAHKRMIRRARFSLLPNNKKSVTIVLTGDTSFGENYQLRLVEKGKENILDSKGYDYCMENFAPLLNQSDLVISNLETPITDLETAILAGKKPYLHWSDITKTPEALKKHNVHVVSLANNHSIDYGQEGLKQTLNVLHQYDIKFIGAGLNKEEASRGFQYNVNIGKTKCQVIVVAGFEYRQYYDKVLRYYAKSETGGIKAWALRKTGQEILRLRKKNSDAFIIAYPHWGENYQEVTEKQQKLAHILIDSGVDLVIGHGSHMQQGMEEYQGRWIVYSLGNFVFNTPGRFRKLKVDPLSLIARLHFSEVKENMAISLRLYPIYTDNNVTQYKSDFVTEDQLKKSQKLLIKNSPLQRNLIKKMRLGKDEFGKYFVVDLLHEPYNAIPS